jgi:DNA-binding Lrp family transcriptional regulator
MRPLDDIDHKILVLMRENSRRTLADIGGQVSLSVAAVKRRV